MEPEMRAANADYKQALAEARTSTFQPESHNPSGADLFPGFQKHCMMSTRLPSLRCWRAVHKARCLRPVKDSRRSSVRPGYATISTRSVGTPRLDRGSRIGGPGPSLWLWHRRARHLSSSPRTHESRDSSSFSGSRFHTTTPQFLTGPPHDAPGPRTLSILEAPEASRVQHHGKVFNDLLPTKLGYNLLALSNKRGCVVPDNCSIWIL